MFALKHVLLPSSKALSRNISCSQNLTINRKWREANRLPVNPNSFGPLTDLKDYTYLDGRPTPIGSNMKRRIIRQREIAEKIVTMCKELDEAKERCVHLEKKHKMDRKEILQQKLLPKAKHLLKA